MTQTAYLYLTDQGVIVSDTSGTLAQVQSEWLQAFGADLIVTPDTPQGVMITAEALARNNVINNNAALANQINPNVAGGTFLDAIGLLTGIQRTPGSPTVVPNVTLSGVAGTTIPSGVQAQTAAGDLFVSTAAVTLGAGGSATVNFQSSANGAIPCAENALNIIVTGILGWETVNNTTAGTVGATTQSDQAFRAYRLNTLAFNSISLAAAITSALYETPGVTSLTFQENIAATTETINGISMVARSVYACVEGGTNTAVAAALLENKSSGAAWNGSTSVSVIEPASGQTYTVLFDRPTAVPIQVTVTTPNGNADAITQSILDYAAGLVQIIDQNGTSQTLPGFIVGSSVSPFDISGAIMAENPGVYLSNVQVGTVASMTVSNTPVAIAVNQIATVSANNISVIIT
jgi:uncharacterized phage protein gp47/JayE